MVTYMFDYATIHLSAVSYQTSKVRTLGTNTLRYQVPKVRPEVVASPQIIMR